MLAKNRVGRKTAAIGVAVIVAFGLSSCGFADATSAPPSDTFQRALFDALNHDRASVGLPPLIWSPKLAKTAGTWAQQMSNANVLYHQDLMALLYSSDYANYRRLGENILVGPGSMSANTVEAALRASAPHWANITSSAYNLVGIGYHRAPDGRLWLVQDFGGL
ncbi:MAG TPA: CAP domain-containing protein [Acidimicrobiia bacterium]